MTKRVRARVATDERLEVYGGFQLTRADLQQMAEQLRNRHVPMHYNHDLSQPIAAVIMDAGLEVLPNGRNAVWIEFDVPDADWDFVQKQFDEHGVQGGFSFSTAAPITGYHRDATIEVAADAHHFSDEVIVRAARAFKGHPVSPSRLYQFSSLPEAAIIISLALQVLQEVPVDLLSGMIVDALRSFGRTDAPITIRSVQSKGKSEVIVTMRPRNDREFEAAVAQIPALIRASRSKR